MVVLALALVVFAIWALTRVPTGFLPTEDQGYMIVVAQLPDGASKERTDAVHAARSHDAKKVPGVEHVVTVSGISILDNRASLANAGVAFVVLNDWDARLKQKGQDQESIHRINGALQSTASLLLRCAAAADPGRRQRRRLHDAGRDQQRRFRLRPSAKSRQHRGRERQCAIGLARLATTFRAGAPQFSVVVDSTKAEALGITVGQVFAALSGYVGSNYVAQFNKFGHVFQIYTQANANRAPADDMRNLKVKAGNGTMTPIGTVVEVSEVKGPPLISLYNLYPTATVVGSPRPASVRARRSTSWIRSALDCRPERASNGPPCPSRRSRSAGRSISSSACDPARLFRARRTVRELDPAFRRAPRRAAGAARHGRRPQPLGADNNLYTQIGIILLIALGSKNGILIVEYARQRRAAGKDVLAAAVEAARLRFRPILMTSFAFILGVLPLVLATGAGAEARRSIGIAVFSGMIASTCLVVVFVPSFYVVMQRLEERRTRRAARNELRRLAIRMARPQCLMRRNQRSLCGT